MSDNTSRRSARREFLGQLGVVAGALAGSASFDSVLAEGVKTVSASPWDVSWVDKLSSAKFRVALDGAATPNENNGPYFAQLFLDQFHEVYDTADSDTRAVFVIRQLGTAIGLNDAMWEKYPVGEQAKINERGTKTPAKRNVFWKAGPNASADDVASSLEHLMSRGVLVVVCNIAAGNFAGSLARATGRDVAETQADVRKNLIPGAVLAPSGVFALMRAGNAGAPIWRA